MTKYWFFAFAVWLALGTLCAEVSRADLTRGLVGYWPLDDLDASDLGRFNLGGSIIGDVGATEDRYGLPAGALRFPGQAGSHVDRGHNDAFYITGAMTVAAWVVVDSANTNNGRIVARQGGDGNRSWSLHIESRGSPATFQIAPDANTIIDVNDPDDLPMDEWVHMVGVYRPGESTEIYVNAVQKGINYIRIPIQQYSDNDATILIGDRHACGNCGWLGAIDDVAIWDRDLTAGEISVLFQRGVDGPPLLMPGDADMDLEFDQLDLVRVQIAGKYLTGQPATWGQGDWDGAPGGSPGNPPPGNGRYDQLDIVAAIAGGHYRSGLFAVAAGGARADGQTSILYDARTGELAVDAPAGIELTSVNIDSAAGIFTGQAAQNLGGSFDNDADGNIFKATFGSSFGSLSFGNVAQPGLAESFVLGDLAVVGSLAGGGGLGNVDLMYVPEPAALMLLALGLAVLVASSCRQKRTA